MTNTRIYQAVRAHVSGAYDKGTLHGKEYIVVPVVALVEGVLQGMAAEGPELALAEEFGKFPDSWNGRPIVMSHPTKDSKPVSANSPDVLQEYQIGFIFNAKMDGSKLCLEAWCDPDMMANLNDDSKATLETLQAGTMIEVSTGYFAEIEPTSGVYANSTYDSIQRSVVPDHLAFLPNGVLGACSNADGCGAQLAVNSKPTDEFPRVKTFYAPQPCCDSCASGHTCEGTSSMPSTNKDMASKDKADKKKKQDPKAYQEYASTIANTLAGGVTFSDARDAVCEVLKVTNAYSYVVAMTKDTVIYEQYNSFTGSYETYQRGYAVSIDGKVTLDDNVERVRLMTKVVTVNADGSVPEDQPEQNMTTSNNGAAAASTTTTAAETTTTVEPKVHKVENEQGTLEVTVNEKGEPTGFVLTPKAQPVAAHAAPKTVAEFVAQAPAEMQEIFQSGIKLHAEKKDGLIKGLLATNRCKFDEAKLKTFSLDMLESLAELAQVPSFAAQARPFTIVDNSSEDDNVTPAPLVFEAPKASTAA